MMQSTARKGTGRKGRFWMAVAVVFGLQVTLLFLSGKPASSDAPVAQRPAPAFRLGDPRPSELAALDNPTLFVLPHPRGFSGPTWMRVTNLEYSPEKWTEHPRPLPLDPSRLGTALVENMPPVPQPVFRILAPSDPVLISPRAVFGPALRTDSRLRIEGSLAGRRLLNPAPLPTVADAQTNSVIDVLVDERGFVFSAVPSARTGSTNDQLAVQIALSKQFEPMEPAGPGRPDAAQSPMTTGTLIFEWRPSPPTNAPPVQ